MQFFILLFLNEGFYVVFIFLLAFAVAVVCG